MPQPLWQVVRHTLQIAYLCFHFSVAALIAVQLVKRKQAFCKGFYVLYVVQSLFDVCALFFVSSCDTNGLTLDNLVHPSQDPVAGPVGPSVKDIENCQKKI